MLMDKLFEVAVNQDFSGVTTATPVVSTNSVPLTHLRDIGAGMQLFWHVHVKTLFTSGTNTAFVIPYAIVDTDVGLASIAQQVVGAGPRMLVSDMVANSHFYIPIGPFWKSVVAQALNPDVEGFAYAGVSMTCSGENLTGGTATINLCLGPAAHGNYLNPIYPGNQGGL